MIPPIKNMDQLQKQLNADLEALEAAKPTYATALPAIGDVPDGRLAVRASDQTLHQAQAGVWVQLT
jgi:hypothetical protein